MSDSLIMPVIAGLVIGAALVITFGVNSAQPYAAFPLPYYQSINDGENSALSLINGCTAPKQTGIESVNLKNRTWISVSRFETASDMIGRNLSCVAATSDLLAEIPKLKTALNGAEGCINGTEVCEISHGLSGMIAYPNGIVVADSKDYELSLSKQEATLLISRLDLEDNRSILAYDDRLYLLALHTTDSIERGAQIEVEFEEPIDWHPISLEQGESVSFDLLVRTWATYGGPVDISMEARSSARDSGLIVSLEPDSMVMDERSETKVKLTVTAPTDEGRQVKSGTYETYVGGKVNDFGLLPSPCGLDGQCPVIAVGDSKWAITTYGNDSSSWMGGKEPPDWLSAEIVTSDSAYSVGETVAVKVYLANNGEQEVTFDNPRMFLQIFGSERNDGSVNVYGFDASLDGSITVEPKSRTLLAREFEWDQMTYGNDRIPGLVRPGTYGIGLALSGHEGYVFHDQKKVDLRENRDNLSNYTTDSGSQEIRADSTIVFPKGASEVSEAGVTFLEPQIAYVNVGGTFQWENQDYAPHTATSSLPDRDDAGRLFDTKIVPPRQTSGLYSLDTPGEYQYFCILHPWMVGTIIAKET